MSVHLSICPVCLCLPDALEYDIRDSHLDQGFTFLKNVVEIWIFTNNNLLQQVNISCILIPVKQVL